MQLPVNSCYAELLICFCGYCQFEFVVHSHLFVRENTFKQDRMHVLNMTNKAPRPLTVTICRSVIIPAKASKARERAFTGVGLCVCLHGFQRREVLVDSVT